MHIHTVPPYGQVCVKLRVLQQPSEPLRLAGQQISRSSSFKHTGSDVAQPTEELAHMQQELAGARAKLLAARAEAQRLQARALIHGNSSAATLRQMTECPQIFLVQCICMTMTVLLELAAIRPALCMQVAVAREHEARQLVERGLMEAHAGMMPVSATHELALQVCRATS